MKFVIGFAGIPHEVYDQIYKKRDIISTPEAEFISKPLKPNTYTYSDDHADFFINEFRRRIQNDHNNQLSDTAFALVCINHGDNNTTEFLEKFFPFTLSVLIGWELECNAPNLAFCHDMVL